MIFGFNTDVKVGETAYHVQTEARANDRVLQTQVFVRGRCLGKRTQPFPEAVNASDEEPLRELLKQQHRLVLDAVREGRVESVLAIASQTPPTTSPR